MEQDFEGVDAIRASIIFDEAEEQLDNLIGEVVRLRAALATVENERDVWRAESQRGSWPTDAQVEIDSLRTALAGTRLPMETLLASFQQLLASVQERKDLPVDKLWEDWIDEAGEDVCTLLPEDLSLASFKAGFALGIGDPLPKLRV